MLPRLLILLVAALIGCSCSGQTQPATNVNSSWAMLNATGNPSPGKGVTFHFEYSDKATVLQAGEGLRTPAVRCVTRTVGICSSTQKDVPIKALITKLTAATTYYYRLCGHDIDLLHPFAAVEDKCTRVSSFKTDARLIVDGHFTHGFEVQDPVIPFPIVGRMSPNPADPTSPSWAFAQIHSFYPIDHAKSTLISSGLYAGMREWINLGKRILVRSDAAAKWDYVSVINTVNEYQWNKYHIYPHWVPRVAGDNTTWGWDRTFPGYAKDPVTKLYHFKDYRGWVAQYSAMFATTTSRRLNTLSHIDFKLTAQALYQDVKRTSDNRKDANGNYLEPGKRYDPVKHNSFYVAWIHMRNMTTDKTDPGYGHRATLAVPIYNTWLRLAPKRPPMVMNTTPETTIPISQSDVSGTQSLWDGKPVTFSGNLITQARAGILAAFPNDKISDYAITNFHMGWEAGGPVIVNIAVKDLEVNAY